MAPKMGEGGQIWLKYITGDLIMMIRDKNNFFERVKKNHADLAWNYPEGVVGAQGEPSELRAGCSPDRGQAHSWRWTWQGELFGLFVSIISGK